MKFTYSIPLIGRVEIYLDGYPYEFYQIMKRQGEVDRLRKLAHLGVIQNIFPGIRHTRWDYTVTMLYLIQQFSKAKIEGLSSTKKIREVKLSGRDIMQLLALAANIGHLPGTFSIEKGLMRYLARNDEIASELVRLVEIRQDEFKQVDYLNFNKILVLLKLQEWLKNAYNREENLLRVVKEFVVECFITEPTTEHRRKIVDYFNIVRRVSYQLLDCLYVNLPLRVEYSEFINQLPALAFEKGGLTTLSELIDQYTRIVYKQIYHSNEARKMIAVYANRICETLEKSSNVLATVWKWLIKSDLCHICGEVSGPGVEAIVSVTVPYGFWSGFFIESVRDKQVDALEADLAKMINPAKPVILYVPGLRDPVLESSTAGDLILDVYSENAADAVACFKTVGLTLAWVHRKFERSWGTGRVVKAIVESILLRLTSNPSNIELSIDIASDDFFRNYEHSVPEDRIRIFSTGQRKNALQMFRRENKSWNPLTKQLYNECKILKELMKRKWMSPRKTERRYHVVVPGRIKFRDKHKREDISEFDGAFLTTIVRKRRVLQMVLFLIEAKAGKRTGKSSARKELEDKLHELGLSQRYRIGKIGRNAYVEITLV